MKIRIPGKIGDEVLCVEPTRIASPQNVVGGIVLLRDGTIQVQKKGFYDLMSFGIFCKEPKKVSQ